MKNLHNTLLLKQLLILKQLGYRYTNITPSELKDESWEVPNDIVGLQEAVDGCHLCELSKSRTKSVFGEGSLNADIMFIGSKPSATEDSTGRVFVGRAGNMLTAMIENVLHLSRDEVYITNLLKCKPLESRVSISAEIVTCKPYLQKQIEIVKPKLIITLGSTAYKYLTNDESSLEKVRGSIIQKDDYAILPTYHPNYLLRNPSAKKDALSDLIKGKELIEKLTLL